MSLEIRSKTIGPNPLQKNMVHSVLWSLVLDIRRPLFCRLIGICMVLGSCGGLKKNPCRCV